MTKNRIREITMGVFNEAFNSQGYTGNSMGYSGAAPNFQPPDPDEIEITDETVGVMDFDYKRNEMDVESVLEKLQPYLEDLEIEHAGLNDEFELVSVNVKYKYRDLLESLFDLFGFNLNSETFGNEARGSKKMYGPRIMSPVGGVHGRFSLPFLIGEIPGGVMYESKRKSGS